MIFFFLSEVKINSCQPDVVSEQTDVAVGTTTLQLGCDVVDLDFCFPGCDVIRC